MSERSTRLTALDRRRFCQSATAALVVGVTSAPRAWAQRSPSDKPVAALIGASWQGRWVGRQFAERVPLAAVADVDSAQFGRIGEMFDEETSVKLPETCSDYRRVLDRPDIDVVAIATPDHWHTKIAIEAMQAGKDVYCEKPLTLTIEEGQRIVRAQESTGRTLQVGTQQRSDQSFQTAVALVRAGRIGKVRRVWVAINGGPTGGPFTPVAPPKTLDWDRWLGQAPLVDYIPERCHHNFRWWYEYSGGKLTDWGAHHVDIAQWAAGLDETSPISVNPLRGRHPVPMEGGTPQDERSYNTATEFVVECRFADGTELRIQDKVDEPGIASFPRGILFEGDRGRLFVNRNRLSGRAVDELAENPLPEKVIAEVRGRHETTNHVEDFLRCVEDGETPRSSASKHHRVLTTCHLSNIALRLGRPVRWSPDTESMPEDDAAANAMVSRTQRKGYELPS